MSEIAESFLRRFHARRPGVTREAFARGRSDDGRSSYELLADHAPAGARVLDLGCGDGWLLAAVRARGAVAFGIDLSREELAGAGAGVVQARAEAIPFARGAFGACLSHLAFSILPDPAAAAIEIARVLAPGGVLAIVTGGGPGLEEDAFEWMLACARPYLARAPRVPRLGDKRARSADGLDTLLGPAGFAPCTWRAHTIDLGGAFDEVWATLATSYELDPLDAGALASLRADLAARAPAGRVPCTMRIAVAAAVLAPATR